MITQAQAVLAAFTVLLIAAIAISVFVVVAQGGDKGQAPHDLSRDLTAAAGRATATPEP